MFTCHLSTSFLNSARQFLYGRPLFASAMRTMCMNTLERKMNVNGLDINYLSVGRGSEPVLLCPGAIGTIWTDFKHQIDHLDRDKFTIIAWDPPGYGKSRPPERVYTEDFYHTDAKIGLDIMNALGYSTFSLIGWSDGGITSLIMSATYPESIKKMIIIGASAYIEPMDMSGFICLKDINIWSKEMKDPLIEVYGEDHLRNLWIAWVDNMEIIYKKQNGDICTKLLENIECPTLIVQGQPDPMVYRTHPLHLHKRIKNSKVHIFKNGKHNPHMLFYEEFNQLATNFLLKN